MAFEQGGWLLRVKSAQTLVLPKLLILPVNIYMIDVKYEYISCHKKSSNRTSNLRRKKSFSGPLLYQWPSTIGHWQLAEIWAFLPPLSILTSGILPRISNFLVCPLNVNGFRPSSLNERNYGKFLNNIYGYSSLT